MDLYSAERQILERHEHMVRSAERRAALSRESAVSVRVLIADGLRSLADRIDERPGRKRVLKVLS